MSDASVLIIVQQLALARMAALSRAKKLDLKGSDFDDLTELRGALDLEICQRLAQEFCEPP